jgi:hypothetical protein
VITRPARNSDVRRRTIRDEPDLAARYVNALIPSLTQTEARGHYERYVAPYFTADGRDDPSVAAQAVSSVAEELGVSTQGPAVGPHEGQYRRIVWRYVGGVHGDADCGDLEVVADEGQQPQAVLPGGDLGVRVLPTNAASMVPSARRRRWRRCSAVDFTEQGVPVRFVLSTAIGKDPL